MVSKKIATALIIIALLLAVISIVVSVSSNVKEIPKTEQDSNVNIIPDIKTGQVGIIINKPSGAP